MHATHGAHSTATPTYTFYPASAGCNPLRFLAERHPVNTEQVAYYANKQKYIKFPRSFVIPFFPIDIPLPLLPLLHESINRGKNLSAQNMALMNTPSSGRIYLPNSLAGTVPSAHAVACQNGYCNVQRRSRYHQSANISKGHYPYNYGVSYRQRLFRVPLETSSEIYRSMGCSFDRIYNVSVLGI